VANSHPVPGDRVAVILVTRELYPVYLATHGWSARVVHYSDTQRDEDCEACARGTCVQRVEVFAGGNVIVHDQLSELS
jgi:hypothetical protein